MALSFNDQATEIVDIAANHRANHRAGVSVQVIQIHFQNRLPCAYLRALFHQTFKAFTFQRYGVDTHMDDDLRAFFGFQAERVVGVEDFHDCPCGW